MRNAAVCERTWAPVGAAATVVARWRRALSAATRYQMQPQRLFVALVAGLCCCAVPAAPASAQQPDSVPVPVITPRWEPEQSQPHEALLELRLDRPLTAADGRLALLVGSTDLSSLIEMSGTAARLSLRGESNAGGTSTVTVSLVRPDGAWTELGQSPLRRRTSAGFDSTSWQLRIDAQSDGQLGNALPPSASPTRAAPFQDVSWNGGFRSLWQRGGWTSELQSLLVAVAGTGGRSGRARGGAQSVAGGVESGR